MSVRDLLASMDSMELAEWQAFERALGPIGPEYNQGTLAAIHEQLQAIAWLVGAQFEENPVSEPRSWPRPAELFNPTEAQRVEREQQDEPVDSSDELNAFFDSVT